MRSDKGYQDLIARLPFSFAFDHFERAERQSRIRSACFVNGILHKAAARETSESQEARIG